jgi:endoglucanase
MFAKIVTYILFLSLLLPACSADAHDETPVAVNGQLRVSGVQLVNVRGEPAVLRGMSFGWHNFWPRFYNKDAVKYLGNDLKCSVVRAAMGVGTPNCYLENPAFALQCVENVVDGAIDRGMYVIIDFHSHKLHLEEAKSFFTQMAGKYGDTPNVIYEIWNEPDDTYSWPEVKAYAEEVIDAIRAVDPDNLILVGSPHWDQDIDAVAADPITGRTNILYTMHFYAATHGQWLRDRTDAAIAQGIPVFVSECAGMEATGDGPIDIEEWKRYLNWMEKNNISWVAWSVSDKDETCSMLLPDAKSEGDWGDSVMKEWGKIVCSCLQKIHSCP